MFSGLVNGTGVIKEINQNSKTITMTIAPTHNQFLDDAQIGDSISIDGTCLTIEKFDDNHFTVSLMPQNFEKTTFKNRNINEPVNLERSLVVGSRLEGHIVTGHVDEVTQVLERCTNENAIELVIKLPHRLIGQVVPQGSVAINGVSLTVMNVENGRFSVGLIPHTQTVTNLDTLQANDLVNLETDILGKYVMANVKAGNY
ncbi:riboflavin synthase [Limosilactobacillus coleohominis]|uniref:riboflavin synthase n=1 Tax=Limosilactobacillus coleohominis TaxID=181675 RepID=UPI00195DA2AD|nr:riboflavin synthase [Limosilactobacillus coleohominis]MBM6954566.1 riboflavin synthase [Limosilactobacillus coleohominis]